MIAADLVGAAGNARDIAAIGELQLKLRLLVDGFFKREGFLQPRLLGFVETLRVLDQLDDLVFLLGLE